jgi:cardiolipin synthase
MLHPVPLALAADWLDSPAVATVAAACVAMVAFLLFLVLFEPGLAYRVEAPEAPLDSDAFLHQLGALADAQVHPDCRVEVLTDGDRFYPAEWAAVAAARRTVNAEFYILDPGEAARRFLAALAERARAGVAVNLLLDAVGSHKAGGGLFDELRAAGGRVAFYQPLRWYNFKRLNNRTHRDLLVVDGAVGFLGGAGVADHWLLDRPDRPRWRDTMVRVEGGAVPSLQATFVENWLEAADEVLTGDRYFPFPPPGAGGPGAAGLVVNSAPSAGRATRARILFQVLLASARRTVHITTPYFLPDASVRGDLVKAVRERGVAVRVVTTGDRADHTMTRRSSRRVYGELLAAGVEIHEFVPAMLHAKALVVDGVWGVVGSTNVDARSFGHNDEVNLAVRDPAFAARLDEDFARHLARSRRVTLEEWRGRPMSERVVEALTRVLDRQQ